jgi:Ca2+-binding RTX toxin-like protein
VIIESDREELANSGIATVKFTFNTKPIGFALDDIKVTNGVLTNLVPDPLNPSIFTAQFIGGTTDRSGMSTIKVEGTYADTTGASGAPSNTITIKNVDKSFVPTVGFISNNMTVMEGNAGTKLATFELVLSAAAAHEVTVSYSTDIKTFGTAKAGSDYLAKAGNVVFAAGETKKTITVEIVGDTAYESDETFYVDIVGAKGATVVVNGAEGLRNSWVAATIKNDDAAPVPTVGFAKNNTSIVEGNEGKKFLQVAVNLSAASSKEVSVDFTTDKKTFGSATAGVDFIAAKGTLLFAPGETTKIISVEVIGDKVHEANETFYIDLVSAKGASVVVDGAEGLRNSWVAATIQNDDVNEKPTVGFATNNLSVTEGNSGTKHVQFTVSLSGAAKQEVTVEYSTELKAYGTAKAYQDYVPTTGKIVFAPGETSKIISVEIVGDTAYESNEHFYVDLVKATGADIVMNGSEGLRNSWIAATINNDDVSGASAQYAGVIGTTGNDKIGGTAHADLIDGRGGFDMLTGFAGNDTFVFGASYASKTLQNASRILDFKDGFDLIGLQGGLNFSDLIIKNSAEGAVVSLANGDALVVLVGVHAASVGLSDFVNL